MKKLIFILALIMSINMFGQRPELWGEISTLTELSPDALIKELKSNCVGRSKDYIVFLINDNLVEISYENDKPERIVIGNFKQYKDLKELLTERNTFIPIKGYDYFKVYFVNGDLTLIRE